MGNTTPILLDGETAWSGTNLHVGLQRELLAQTWDTHDDWGEHHSGVVCVGGVCVVWVWVGGGGVCGGVLVTADARKDLFG